jgi:hypothetical protein
MAKDSDRRRGGFDAEETGGGLSGLFAEEDEFDRRSLWRLGTWAAVSVGAVVLALASNQSSTGLRREQTASADLVKQAQQLQLAARESQNETRRLASAVDTLNSDRDRLYSRVAVLEQGLDSVTGTIARQAPAPSAPQAKADSPAGTNQVSASAAPPVSPSTPSPASAPSTAPTAVSVASVAPAPAAPPAPAPTASVEPSPAVTKPAPATAAPVVAPVIATASAVPDKAVPDKKDKQASAVPPSEPSPAAKSASAQQSAAVQPPGSLVAPKSMMGPPDPAAGKLIEASTPPKTVTSAPLPEIAAVATKEIPEEADADSAAPELVARRTEFGVDVGTANSIPGLRALWRGLLKSRVNAALTTLRPIIVIKENNNGLGMQLRLVAGPINDAAAAAKICASLTVSERGCTTAVFEGQRLSMGADDQPKVETRAGTETKPASETKPEAKPVSEAKPDPDAKPGSYSRFSGRHHYMSKRAPKEEAPPTPKQEPSTLSRLFSSH